MIKLFQVKDGRTEALGFCFHVFPWDNFFCIIREAIKHGGNHMNTTIAAISTAVSASGIGIIRISGPEAMDVISRIYRSKGGKKKIKEVPTHTIHYGYIYDGEEAVDEVLVMVMRAPKTFTGEDTVEIDCHGGV